MGIFSSKTRINVYSQAYSLMESSENPYIDSTIKAIFSRRGDIAQELINDNLNSVHNKMRRMREYAKDNYTLGLPTGTQNTSNILPDGDVLTALIDDIGLVNGAVLDFNFVAPLNNFYVSLPFLTKERGYSIETNYITNHPPGMVYPPDPSVGGDETVTGRTHSVSVDSVTSSTDLLTLTIIYKITSSFRITTVTYDEGLAAEEHRWETVLSTDTEDISNTIGASGYRMGQIYCVAKYYALDGGGQPSPTPNWWFYDIFSNKYPNLNTVYQDDEANGLYPVIPIRYNNVDLTDAAHQSTPLYITSKALLKKVDMDLDYLGTQLNDNPSIGDIDHAYVMFGIDLNTTKNSSILYLTEFFDFLHDNALKNQFQTNDEYIGYNTVKENTYSFLNTSNVSGSISWSDTDTYNTNTVTNLKLNEHGLDVGISFRDISSTLVPGSIGDVGTATIEKKANTLERNPGKTWFLIDNSVLTLRHQITDSVYKEVKVTGLVHINRIYDGYSVRTNIEDIIHDNNNANLIIPLHYGTMRRIPVTERNQIYMESFQIVMNSVVFTEVKWYQQKWFRGVMIVLAFVVAVWSGQAWLVKLAAVGIVGAAALLIVMIGQYLISLAFQYVFKLVADAIGSEALLIVAAVVAVIAIAGGGAGGFKAINMITQATAKTMLTVSTLAVQGAKQSTLEDIEEIVTEGTEFEVEAKERTEELQAIRDELNLEKDNLLQAEDLLATTHYAPQLGVFNENITYGNVGARVFDFIPNYVEVSLQLPVSQQDHNKYYNSTIEFSQISV